MATEVRHLAIRRKPRPAGNACERGRCYILVRIMTARLQETACSSPIGGTYPWPWMETAGQHAGLLIEDVTWGGSLVQGGGLTPIRIANQSHSTPHSESCQLCAGTNPNLSTSDTCPLLLLLPWVVSPLHLPFLSRRNLSMKHSVAVTKVTAGGGIRLQGHGTSSIPPSSGCVPARLLSVCVATGLHRATYSSVPITPPFLVVRARSTRAF